MKVSVHQRKARDYIQREDWGNALVELERLLEADRDNPTLQNQVGDVYLRKEDVARACEHFEAAIDLYAQVGLHNNAVALCKKVMRLRPGRFEMRYRLARLRLDQGFRSEAAAFFRDYLDHVPDDDDYAPKLEANCREMVELLPEEAPLGKILEKLEALQRYVAAYEIVRKLSQRAADTGDEATARRYTEKLRSLRILVERSGGRDLLAEPAAGAPEPNQVSLPPTPAPAPAAADTPLVLEPTLDPAVAEMNAGAAEAAEPATAIEMELPEIFATTPPETAVPAPAAAANGGSVLDSILESFTADESIAKPQAPEPKRKTPAAPPEAAPRAASFWNEPQPLDAAAEPPAEYELTSGSFADLAQALGGESEVAADAAVETDSDAAFWDSTPAEMTHADGQAPELPPETAQHFAAAAWGEPLAPPPPTAAPALRQPPPPPPPAAPRVVQPFAAPASPAGWIEELRRAPVWIPTGDADTQINPQPESDAGANMELESVIDSFREQMARALDGDGAARYDLGVAYYEMGLYNEALAEFESAARCPGLEVQSFEMLAACLLQTGRHAEVVELLLPVLAADGHSPRGRLGLHYSLGLAYEALGDWNQAQRCFEEVALVDIDFKDVQARLRRT